MVRGLLVHHQQDKKPTPLFLQAGTAAGLEQNCCQLVSSPSLVPGAAPLCGAPAEPHAMLCLSLQHMPYLLRPMGNQRLAGASPAGHAYASYCSKSSLHMISLTCMTAARLAALATSGASEANLVLTEAVQRT